MLLNKGQLVLILLALDLAGGMKRTYQKNGLRLLKTEEIYHVVNTSKGY